MLGHGFLILGSGLRLGMVDLELLGRCLEAVEALCHLVDALFNGFLCREVLVGNLVAPLVCFKLLAKLLGGFLLKTAVLRTEH